MQSGPGGAAGGAAAGGNDYNEVTAARRGRFRVTSSTPSGPPETTLGRFRLMPTCKCPLSLSLSLIICSACLLCLPFHFAANYGAISPILQRGRFAVIPEEPQAGSPALSTPPPGGSSQRRSPSPEWDFDIEQVSFITISAKRSGGGGYFLRLCRWRGKFILAILKCRQRLQHCAIFIDSTALTKFSWSFFCQPLPVATPRALANGV